MAAVTGLNHLTLAVADVERSVAFYRDLLGFRLRAQGESFAYLEAGLFWLCLSRDAATRTTPHADYTHVALDVAAEDFGPLVERARVAARIWKDNRSEGDSLYLLDPDGHKLELHVGSLESRLAHYRTRPAADGIRIFD
jgi:catechol 2,3-dioxygenase-like lactoylglutathione lyase family enzyme